MKKRYPVWTSTLGFDIQSTSMEGSMQINVHRAKVQEWLYV